MLADLPHCPTGRIQNKKDVGSCGLLGHHRAACTATGFIVNAAMSTLYSRAGHVTASDVDSQCDAPEPVVHQHAANKLDTGRFVLMSGFSDTTKSDRRSNIQARATQTQNSPRRNLPENLQTTPPSQ
jgi:hypothetical protein